MKTTVEASKPISSQDYLRHPMQCIDKLLCKIHSLYLEIINDKNVSKMKSSPVFKNFLKEVVELPFSIAAIFGFDSTLILFDHIDLLNVIIDEVSLIELQLETLEKCQFIVSVEDSMQFNKILLKKKERKRTKSINGNEIKNNQAISSSKTARSISFGNKNANIKKLSGIVSNIDQEKAKNSTKTMKKNESFLIQNFASKMVKVPVTDTCYSSYDDNVLEIELEEVVEDDDEKNENKNDLKSIRNAKNFKNFSNVANTKKIPIPTMPFKKNITISSDTCGGCPTFVSRFDDICKGLFDLKNTVNHHLKLEKAIILTEKVEILLDLLISFGPDQQDGPPPVKTVSICNKNDY